MDITFLGHSSFKLRGKSASLITDPFDPEMVGLKYPKNEADIVTISHDHGDHNKADLVSGVRKIVSLPGEYEIMGVSILGYPSFHDSKKGELRGKNTIFIIEMDELRIAHLGDLGHGLDDSTVEALGNIDVLMIPVGGEYTIGPEDAVELVRTIEPYVIFPMHYQASGLDQKVFEKLKTVDDFISSMGLPVVRDSKFSLKKQEMTEDQKIVVLEKR